MAFDSDAYEFIELKKSNDLCKYIKFFKASPASVKVLSVFVLLEVVAAIAVTAFDGSKLGYGVIFALYLLGAILKREKWAFKVFIAWRIFVLAFAAVLLVGLRCATDRQTVEILATPFMSAAIDSILSIPACVVIFLPGVRKWANNATSFKC